MRDDLKLLAEVFGRRERRLARLKPRGFMVGEELHPALRGSITAWTMVRKLFRRGRVVCSSDDGVEGAADHPCDSCKREGCSPRIRLRIEPVPGGPLDGCEVVLELNWSSSRNFLDYAAGLAAEYHEAHELVSVLTVADRGKWGEVLFAVDRQLTLREPEK